MALSNIDLENLAKLLKLRDFRVCLQDELKEIKANIRDRDGKYIINYGNEKDGGTHWIAVIIENNNVFVFDSFGAPCSNDVADFIRGKKHISYNQYIIQDLNSSLCGWYCLFMIYFVQEAGKSKPFYERCNNFINLFHDDTTKNGEILRRLFHSNLPLKQTPSRYWKILKDDKAI
jgi:hypothetical protein